MYELISKTIDKQFSEGAFKSNFFEKDDLISDLYIYLSEFDKDFTELELLEVIKKKYFNYFEIYDIKDKNSYDKFEDSGSRGLKEGVVHTSNSQEIKIYEFFEKIIWKNGVTCPKCKSKDCFPNKESVRQHDCRNCGNTFSFSQNTNMRQKNIHALKNIIAVYKLVSQGVICFKEIQEKTGLSKNEVKNSYNHTLPNIINNEDLIKPLKLLPLKIKEPVSFKEHAHQTKTIAEALDYFKTQDRGKIIHPCGSGKTYTAIQIAKKLEPKRLLVVIPSKLLLKQQIENFLPYFDKHVFYAFGSLKTYEKEFKQKKVILLGDTVERQKKQIKAIDKNIPIIIFTTLTSFAKMQHDFVENYFDFAIFDEAHRVAGEDYKMFLRTVTFTSYKKALFLTATEKNYNEEGATGMNNKVFGENISKIYMREMIDAGVICDYNIVNIGFTDENIKNILNENKSFFIDVKIKLPVKTKILISALSLVKSIENYPIKKIITYHSTIEESILFSSIFNLFQNKYGINYNCYNLHSKQSGFNFQSNLYNFIRSEKAVISSVNCFQEGIDVIDVDAVLYSYPKKSKIDIPQSVGRCVRKSPGKLAGYVIVPDKMEDSNTYKKLFQILKALETCDKRLENFKTKIYNRNINHNILFEQFTSDARLDFNIDEFYSKIITLSKKEYFLSFNEAKELVISKGIKTTKEYFEWGKSKNFPNNLPKYPNESYPEWKSWTHFLGKNKGAKKGYLTYNEASDWARFKNIKNSKDYYEIEKPHNIPSSPDKTYKLTGEWKSWFDFLQNGKQCIGFLDYNDAKVFIKDLEVKNGESWIKLIKENPELIKGKIPKWPESFYKSEWQGWEDFLGKKTRGKQFISYEQASIWASNVGIKSSKEYRNFKNKPDDIPHDVIGIYKEEWKGWDDFLKRN